ncbi:MAG: T9SS type A sorting domain-containing protein [Flavobacteriales bacterium]|nr:T9SS type A sorting domain-containing protein [Flavobacteriales bacterium]
MKYKLLLSTFLCVLTVSMLRGQIHITEVRVDLGDGDMYNTSAMTVNISSYWLCNFPTYDQLSTLTVVCGSLNLAPGEYVAIEGFGISAADGECGLYSSPNYASSAAIVDYVEWGSTGHFRSSTAVAGGVWTTGAFAPAMAAGQSIGVDGNGYAASNWVLYTTPTICDPNVSTAVCEGGMVSLSDESTNASVCVMDGEADVLEFATNSGSEETYQYIITDFNNVVLGFVSGTTYDFDNDDPGICLVYGLSYAGNLTVQEGDNLDDGNLADDCFELSSNFITINREFVDGGDVTLTDGSTLAYACFGDNETNYSFINTSESGAAYMYVVVENGIILEVITGNENNFGFMANAMCQIYGVSFTGDFLLGTGMNFFDNPASTGCYAISDSYALVITHSPEGGMLDVNGETELNVCSGSMIDFANNSGSNLAYSLAITDVDDLLIEWVDGVSFDFSGYAEGTYRVYGLSYANITTIMPGDNIMDMDPADQCFEWSENFMTINVTEVDGGEVMTIDGTTAADICTNLGFVEFSTTSLSGAEYAYLIVDESGSIIQIVDSEYDFVSAIPGIYHVYGLSWTGNLLAAIGVNISEDLSDGCAQLSSNSIDFTLHEIDGGSIETSDGQTSVSIIIEGDPDVLNIVNDSESVEEYSYMLTDENNVMIELIAADYDFDNTMFALYDIVRVYGVSHWLDLSWIDGETIDDLASFGCHEVSENYIEITIEFGFSINDSNAPSITLYPNPANDQIFVLGMNVGATYEVTDLSGRQISSGKATSMQVSVDVSLLNSGTYIFNSCHEGKCATQLFVVE